jgi:SAM-dependent methyltransferase
MGECKMSQNCIICGSDFNPYIDDIVDYEYGVNFSSNLVICSSCGLVTHMPNIKAEQIPSLYPTSYLAHSAGLKRKGVYGFLKGLLAWRTANNCSKNIPNNGCFLEIGCGNAELISEISSLRGDVDFIGVDIEDVVKPTINKFTFIHGQLEDSNITENSVDMIYCSNLIEHVANPRVFLQECRKILKPNGVIIGVTPDHLSIDRYVFGKYWAGYHYPRHTYLFNHNNIKKLLRSEGFSKISATGAYGFWYLSMANKYIELPGLKKRGVLFAVVTAIFLPLDIFVNFFRCSGSMSFIGHKKDC